MIISNPTTSCILMLFAILARLISAYDGNGPPCETDECFVDIKSDDALCWMDDDNQNIHYLSPLYGGIHHIPNACRQSNIFGGDGYLVAYPSIGGLVMLRNPLAVDLQYLGLPHTHDTARSPDEDDSLATRMVQLGAQWWPDWNLYFRHSHNVESGTFYDYHFPSKVYVAFPTTGGAWVANFTQDDYGYQFSDLACQPWLSHAPRLWQIRLRYSLSMDDKAEIMKELGATFYASVDQIPGLAKTVHEAVSLFEPFKERLKNMDDPAYSAHFCTWSEEQDKSTSNEKLEKPRWGIWSLFNGLP
ncbi:hypothetical protein PFICI_05366 [Pestalotiopsis fici W106-1]|uniref:Uncharacterized protein n=1 Tax=Pestalotiopsis fici (strain W106-1 / CGMCC3.15140) TaxID=1229662 RepID=W3XBS0_PESFW|nr:uncharacterized protein PFICI_05366 [Pestalotiopsis fici W106-1]ETS83490.1 hypothetical protein PFICI_05366 [Pestalotiopsis fici W106-1]